MNSFSTTAIAFLLLSVLLASSPTDATVGTVQCGARTLRAGDNGIEYCNACPLAKFSAALVSYQLMAAASLSMYELSNAQSCVTASMQMLSGGSSWVDASAFGLPSEVLSTQLTHTAGICYVLQRPLTNAQVEAIGTTSHCVRLNLNDGQTAIFSVVGSNTPAPTFSPF
jgi:hypothetical protein